MLGQAKLKIMQRNGIIETCLMLPLFSPNLPSSHLSNHTVPAISTSERKLPACSNDLLCHLCATSNTVHAITIVVRLVNFDLCPLYSSREGSHRCTWPVRVAMTMP